MKVFLSYSKRDAGFVERLGHDLHVRRYDVWIDSADIVGSGHDRWRRSIVVGIRGSDAVIVVLSPNSVKSENVERELSVAAENKKRVIPVLYQPCTLPDGFQYELAGLQRIDFVDAPYKEALAELVRHLKPAAAAEGPPEQPPTGDAVPIPDPVPVPGPVPVPVEPSPPRRRSRQTTFAAAGAVVAASIVGVVAVLVTQGEGSDDGREPAAATTPPTTPATTPVTPVTPTTPAGAAAAAVVQAWTDAVTRRDWNTVRSISTTDAELTDAAFEARYGAPTNAQRMIAANPYIAQAESIDASTWVLHGASIAWDYGPYPDIRTTVGCVTWTVDLPTETMVWELEGQGSVPTRVPAEEFAATYQAHCA